MAKHLVGWLGRAQNGSRNGAAGAERTVLQPAAPAKVFDGKGGTYGFGE